MVNVSLVVVKKEKKELSIHPAVQHQQLVKIQVKVRNGVKQNNQTIYNNGKAV
jgi:hypothetical protein